MILELVGKLQEVLTNYRNNMNINSTHIASKGNPGFSLIEILLSMFFILAIVGILFSTSGSLLTRRQSDLQSIATKVATKEVERLRADTFTNLYGFLNCPAGSPPPSNTTYDIPIVDSDLTDTGKLGRNNAIGTTHISCYDDPSLPADFLEIQVDIKWDNDNGAEKHIYMDTLIYNGGL